MIDDLCAIGVDLCYSNCNNLLSASVTLLHARMYGERTWYYLWHRFGMIKKLFIEPLLFFFTFVH